MCLGGWPIRKKIDPCVLQIHFSCPKPNCFFSEFHHKMYIMHLQFQSPSDPNAVLSLLASFHIHMLYFTFIMLVCIYKQVSSWFLPFYPSILVGITYNYPWSYSLSTFESLPSTPLCPQNQLANMQELILPEHRSFISTFIHFLVCYWH